MIVGCLIGFILLASVLQELALSAINQGRKRNKAENDQTAPQWRIHLLDQYLLKCPERN